MFKVKYYFDESTLTFKRVRLVKKQKIKRIISFLFVTGITAIFINILLFAVSIILFYYFIEKNQFILSMSITLMLFSLVFGRIFMVKAVEKLD